MLAVQAAITNLNLWV